MKYVTNKLNGMKNWMLKQTGVVDSRKVNSILNQETITMEDKIQFIEYLEKDLAAFIQRYDYDINKSFGMPIGKKYLPISKLANTIEAFGKLVDDSDMAKRLNSISKNEMEICRIQEDFVVEVKAGILKSMSQMQKITNVYKKESNRLKNNKYFIDESGPKDLSEEYRENIENIKKCREKFDEQFKCILKDLENLHLAQKKMYDRSYLVFSKNILK